MPWAALLHRVFGVPGRVCPQCAGPQRVSAASHSPAALAQVLGSLGLSGGEPGRAACRVPPGRVEGGAEASPAGRSDGKARCCGGAVV